MGSVTTVITKNAQETQEYGQTLAAALMAERDGIVKQPLILCLYGELGSGKTTFVQGFAKGLGIVSRLPSPTFIIVRRYSMVGSKNFFYHIDLYRIENTADLSGLGLREIFLDPTGIICIEWAERLGLLLPKNRADITFNIMSKEKRKISLKKVYDI